MKKLIILLNFCFCVDVHDNPLTVEMDICEAINTIQNKSTKKEETESSLLSEWEKCEFNEECETNLCMCETCIDISKFIHFE